MKEYKLRLEHKSYKTLKRYAETINHQGFRNNILLVGPAGTSKSHAAEMLAEDLGVPFAYLPMTQQTTKSDMLGFSSPDGRAVLSLFAKFYVEGGVFVYEEMDAANNNVLLSINAAISGSQGYFAGKMFKRHKDFVLIATANTRGVGSDSDYIGRSKLDHSTLTRFAKIPWDLDEDLEGAIINDVFFHDCIKDVRKEMSSYDSSSGGALYLSMREALTYHSFVKGGMDYIEAAKSTILWDLEESLHETFLKKLEVKYPSKEVIDLTIGVDFSKTGGTSTTTELPPKESIAVTGINTFEELTELNEMYGLRFTGTKQSWEKMYSLVFLDNVSTEFNDWKHQENAKDLDKYTLDELRAIHNNLIHFDNTTPTNKENNNV